MDMPDNQADRQPDSSDSARWMTFAELAKVRGISRLSATTLVRRHGWRRQRDNQSHVIALVPLTWAKPDASGQADDLPDKQPDNRPDSQGYIAAFEATLATVREAHAGEVSALRERAEVAERRADAERQRADAAEEDRRAAEARAATAEGRTDRAEQALVGERDRADAVRARLDALQEQLAAEAEAADQARRQAQAAQDQTQAEARKTHAEVETLREVDTARRAQGLLARLRAAWRGE